MIYRISLVAAFALLIALQGCAHAPPPSTREKKVGPVSPDGVCPHLEGGYGFIGSLVQFSGSFPKKVALNYALPSSDLDALAELEKNYKRSDSGRYIFPEVVNITTLGPRQWSLTVKYPDGQSLGSYQMQLNNDSRYMCNEGVMTWGGHINGRSELGPNTINSRSWLWIDEFGDLTIEQHLNVDMNLTLLHVPTGTAQTYAVYKFVHLEAKQ
ncbi:hypothetical protein [Amantichitinum ursilacus]|uniref:Lipoprotein n=1 Tax=Amantichitinum ursilacus TaxID=857265 RepID=A0A0N0XK81_9NEIS|nr:hypothetical protein [Amantichitinum ursilacus]KPC52551.1 hypothetical protein WG78_11925 [Amantichitinum ursilacus]